MHASRGELAVIGAVTALALVLGFSVAGHPEVVARLLDGDWVAFDRAADRAVTGGWGRLYRDSAGEPFPFLYPPLLVPLLLPLALLGPGWSFVAVTVGAVGAALAGLALLPGRTASRVAVVAAALGSGPMIQMVLVGQLSGLYVGSLAGGAALLRRGRPRAAGIVLALTLVKPNVAAVVVLLLVACRVWRALSAMAAAGAAAVAATVPAGPAPWRAFVETSAGVAGRELDQDIYRAQVTVLSFLRLTLGPALGSSAVSALWLVLAAGAAALTVAVWRRQGPVSLRGPRVFRLMGTVALLAVAFNPRLYFYDALLLAVPAAAWYHGRDGYHSARARAGTAACIVLCQAASVGWFIGVPTGVGIGVASTAWLAIELGDLARPAPRPGPAAPPAAVTAAAAPR